MNDYPSILPLPLLSGYAFSPDESIIRTNMETGLARQRRRYDSAPHNLKLKWLMTETEFMQFEVWYKHKAKEGAEWVGMSIRNGHGLNKTDVRFLKPFKAKLVSNDYWEVMSDVEVRELFVAPESHLDLLLVSNRFHTLVHQTLPEKL